MGGQILAQGYLGQRWITTLEGNGTFNLNQWLAGNRSLRTQARLGPSLEYVLGRRLSLQAGFTPFDIQTFYRLDQRSGVLHLDGQLYEASLRAYSFIRRGNLAPIGPYHRLSLMLLRHRVTDLDQNLFPAPRAALGIYYDLAIAYAFGTQWICWDRVVFDVSLQAGWPLNLGRYPPSGDAEAFLQETLTARLRRFLGFNAQVRVGFLLPFGS
jgi:hypothetical protein